MSDLAVVVPFYNESAWLPQTLAALAAQTDTDFDLVLVDNASTDASPAIAREFAAAAPFPVRVVRETQKGTGAAADTGFRAAIAAGARWIARTDADCLPDRAWVRNIRRALRDEGLEFVGGIQRPRADEVARGSARDVMLRALIWVVQYYGVLLPRRRGSQFRYPYFMVAGNNLAISADLYVMAGGFPRSRIEELHEDRALSETVRTLTARGAFRSDLVVHASARRVAAYGAVNTLRWYRNHGFRGPVVDVR
jgi:glycosyltransferase involved in cell wall biosynthesis